MGTELTCFKGFTPKSFNDLVQMYVQGGYSIGTGRTDMCVPPTGSGLTCIKGFIPKSFNDPVQMQVQGGYLICEEGIEVESPFNSVLNQGAHGFSEHMHYLTTAAVNDAVTDMRVPPTG